MNCIIVDDDASARLIIKQLCKQTKLKVKDEFSSAIEAIKYLNSNRIDVVFLDIHMPTFSGFDLIKTLKESPKIILTTSDKNFALEAFEYNAVVDYLLKPIKLPRFLKSVEKLSNKISKQILKISSVIENQDYIFVRIDKKLIKINISDILLIEAKGDYIKIKTEDKSYIVHSTLKKIYEKLPSKIFMRIHRSYIINTLKIIDIEDNTVLIKKYVVPISRPHKGQLIEKLNLL